MFFSEFTLTFNADLAIDDVVVVRTGNLAGDIIGALQETWVNLRQGSYQVTVGAPTATAGERSAIEWASSFGLDYNTSGLYDITQVGNTVTVKSPVANLTFWQPTTPNPNDPAGPYPALPASVDLDITNYAGTEFTIDLVEFEAATTNPVCTHYRVKVTTSALTTEVQTPVSINPNTNNPFYFELVRGQGFLLSCKAADGQIATQTVGAGNVPGLWNIADVSVNFAPNGSTVTVSVLGTGTINTYEYSLDDSVWQSSNTFPSLPDGNYTVYVRDQFGCKTTQDFIVSGTASDAPYFKYPKLNSILMYNNITHGACANVKNDENTKSCDADVPKPYKQIQQYQTCDIVTSQFWTNYETRTVKVIQEDGTEDDIPVLQRTAHIGLTDMRDAMTYQRSDGRRGIYFLSGNIYDFDPPNNDTGEDYTLNGFLPEWGEIGNYLRIGTSWFLIEDRQYDPDRQADVLIVNDNTAPISDTLIQVASQYNREAYEVFEYVIDFAPYIDQRVQVKLEVQDPNHETITYLSEEIDVKVVHENTVEIVSSAPENSGGIYYSFGIEHKIREEIEYIAGGVVDEFDTNRRDTTVDITNTEVYETDEIVFSPVTKQRMWQIAKHVSLPNVKIRGVDYKKNDSVAVEGPLDETNLYDVSVVMIKAESPYNSQISGDGAFAIEPQEIPGLVNHGSGYVKYN